MTDSFAARALRRTPVMVAALLVVALAGCADMAGIGAHAKLRDAGSLGIASADKAAAPALDSQWWLAFGDAQLSGLVDQAVAGNPNLQVAQARLARAQANADVAGAALKPKVGLDFNGTRQKFNTNYIYPEPLGGSIQNVGLLQLGASWELDFFGKNRTALDVLTQQVIEAGLGTWTGGQGGSLIIRGQARLLETIDQAARVSEIKRLFERLEQQETMLRLLDLAQRGEGVQIFIGAESGLFDSAGLSMVVAPFRNGQEKIVGAIGVIGPTRINYGRVIPVVDYTARVIGRLLG